MKRYIAVILAFLLLTSCESDDFAQTVTRKFRESSSFDIKAKITAEFNDRADAYTVSYNYLKGRDATVKVIEPREIADIEAVIGENGATVKFKDAILETGMDINAVTPMNILHKLVQTWSFKEPSQSSYENGSVLLIFDDGDYQYRTNFNEKFVPICAEIMQNSRLKMKIDFIKCEGIVNAD